ncbi:MAG: MBL fold metallo-hydrolase [Succinivibrio sp.]|jgi:glyoxylase-like metal-dependent hydrolase (beta-lactamase superfamily II)|nr:MBL fold metallo-hydrolase [Succinivibrio sp.]
MDGLRAQPEAAGAEHLASEGAEERARVSVLKIAGMSVTVITSPDTEENCYVMRAGDGEALVVDPNFEPETAQAVADLGAERALILLTHGHCDHICGIPQLQERFETRIVCTSGCASVLSASDSSGYQMIVTMLEFEDARDGAHRSERFAARYRSFGAQPDTVFDDELGLQAGDLSLRLVRTPGHSPGSLCAVLNGAAVFTGDTVMGDRAPILRFKRGSRRDFREVTLPILQQLDPALTALPGHGPVFKLADGFKFFPK